MKIDLCSRISNPTSRLPGLLVPAALFMLACSPLPAHDGDHHHKSSGYQQVNLVGDVPGAAALQDATLINAWGIAFSPTGPFWVSATESGKAVIYSVTNDAAGGTTVSKQALEVTIPGEGNLTGQVFNNTSGFNSNLFLFVSEDGTISGWRPALGTAAETLTTRTGAVYKGVTLATLSGDPVLLAANFSEGTVDVYDANLTLLKQLSDHHAPAGYAPFNVQSIGKQVFVTFAKQDDEKEDDVGGPGHGLIDVLNPRTGKFQRFATGSDAGGKLREISSPWGMALSPKSFGKHGDQLLVGNFGSGTIMAFDADGDFHGLLTDANGEPVTIEGLWALTFGNDGRAGVRGTLYFTAGPGDETHGLFGSLEAIRSHGHGDDDDDD